MDTSKYIEFIINNIGGLENLKSIDHCATRIRMTLHDYDQIDKKEISEVGVLRAAFISNNQYQIVIDSNYVEPLFKELSEKHQYSLTEHYNLSVIAKTIVDSLGGQLNIDSIEFCSTRIRVKLNDCQLIKYEKINNLGQIKALYVNDNLCQIVIGDKSTLLVYKAIGELIDLPVYSETKKFGPVSWFTKAI